MSTSKKKRSDRTKHDLAFNKRNICTCHDEAEWDEIEVVEIAE